MLSGKPWLRLTLVLFLALLARVACGAPATRNVTTEESVARTSNPVDLWVGPGFAFFRSETGFAINFGANIPVSSDLPVFVGLDFGLNFWSRDYYGSSVFINGPSESWTNVQLLPSVFYRVDLARPRILHPYVGLSVGPSIFIAKANSGGPAATQVNQSATKVYFEMLFRPGISVDLSKTIAINVESKFGVLGGDFVYLPQAAISFVL